MAASDKELEAQLLESGNKLVDPPSSVDELLPLLDRVESCLSKVEQSPSDSMEKALSPSLKALVADKLLGHSDVDVKVAVASCISEITRITAPDAPYDDDQMKEVFQLIVSSFENLCDESSRSYAKRTSILETVAKVRSCVVMLDLECDALILEMFQHFLKAIRDYHPENVFSSMETIMTLVLEESEDISLELLTPILDSVKNDNEDVLPISRKLGERVLELCAVKVKPYLVQAVRDLGISLDDYSKVVATICQDADGDVEQNEVQASDDNTEDNAAANEAGSLEQVVISMDRSPQSAMSNGITQNVGDDTLADSSSLKKQEDDQRIENSKDLDVSSDAEPDNLDTEKAADTEQKLEEMTKKRGKKSSSSAKSSAPSESPHADNEKEREELQDQEGQSEDLPRSPNEGPSAEAAVPSENDKGSDVKLSSPKALESESANVASVSPSEKLPEESRSKKSSRQKKKDNSDKEAAPSADNVSKKVADGTSDSELKPNRRSGKKVPAAISNENKASTEVDVSKKESGTTSDTEAKPLRESAKKVDGGSKNEDGSSVKQKEDKKKRTRGKTLSEKDVTKSSAKDDSKDIISTPKSSGKSTKDGLKFEGTPKSNSKRKRTPGKEKESGDKDSDESLVGLRVRVWWPKDQMYYDGIIESFDPVKKKHKVVYTDGDQEILNLKRERFEFIDADSESDEEGETDRSSPDASTETPLKKKVKIKSDEPTKQRKVDPSPKKGGGASTSKSKGTTPKSGRGSKADGKSKDESKSVGKSEDASGGKSKDHTPRTGGSKSANVASKSSSKSRNNDSQTSKATKSKDESSTPSTKSKQEIQKAGKSKLSTPKAATLSKDKTHHSGGKSSANGTGKMKSGSSKVKEVEDVKESSSDSKPHESSKGKSPNPSKAKESEVKTGKKRRRGSKG
ncbi:Armadillo-type fold containing protein [Trema orientale]|uniref:Armadillo-type fold containing protein n=1 Tax=Trema orientale TaxID=63057 RepID=A0A2P5FN32_TREOI|nr:Armadillo-type fold containing protein [Trema orientale]